MKRSFFFGLFAISLSLSFFTLPLYAFDAAGGHRGSITAFFHKDNKIISSGEDGFIVIWDMNEKTVLKRFQLTTYRIQFMVSHPLRDEISIVEAAGLNSYRISAWNYTSKQKLFSLHSTEPVTKINYSGNGNFIIAAGFNGLQITFLDSNTGEIVETPDVPEGIITFAATGRAERNMLIYKNESLDFFLEPEFFNSENEGVILYLDMESGEVTSRFSAPGFSNPVIFSNNRFLAGISSRGLLLVDAASGVILDVFENMERNVLLCPSNDEFYCLKQEGGITTLFRFSVDRNGRLVKLEESPVVFNTRDFQIRITEIAAGQENIAFLTEENDLYFIPLDYRLLENNRSLTMERKLRFSRITPIPFENTDRFMLWQPVNNRYTPQIVYPNHHVDELSLANLIGRFPLRSISSLNDRLLVLDSAGNISLYNLANLSARAEFTFTSPGSFYAALVSDEYITISRSTINNNTPFLSINFRTGETVPVFFNAQAGLMIYTGKSGKIYAEAVEREGNRFKTIVADISAITSPVKIFEYTGEAAFLSIAESSGTLAIACGSDGAFLVTGEIINFERTNGLPVKLLGHDDFFISLDTLGNIAWHDNKNGEILAIFTLYADRWVLTTNREISGRILRAGN